MAAIDACPYTYCGCESCEWCREHHDEQTFCLCACDFDKPTAALPPTPAESGSE